jgi:anti-sigma factor ChrR (cupin superfamily)
MKCKAVQKQLTAYVDGELDEQAREVLKTHLNLCPDCSVAYDAMKKTLAAARAWEPSRLPGGFAEVVCERAARGDTPRPLRLRPSVPPIPRLAWQVGAACLLLVMGLVLGAVIRPRTVEPEAGLEAATADKALDAEALDAEALEMLATLQRLKLLLGLRERTEHMVAAHSEMQRRLAASVSPEIADQVGAYHEAEALIAAGRLDEAEAILGDLESSQPPFVLAPYVRLTRLAARCVRDERPFGPSDYTAVLLGSPERVYEAIAKRSEAFASAYIEALERFDPAKLPPLRLRELWSPD